jgi:hypothetical protein
MSNGYSWQVTAQSNEQNFDAQGNVTNGKSITFTIPEYGYTGTIFVPDAVYSSTDAVKNLIQSEVDQVVAVHQLNG